jgi:hypothetical protein
LNITALVQPPPLLAPCPLCFPSGEFRDQPVGEGEGAFQGPKFFAAVK